MSTEPAVNRPRRWPVALLLAAGVFAFLWSSRTWEFGPRDRVSVEAKARPEFGKTGVYVLRGPSESGDLPTVYVSEGDPARPRLATPTSARCGPRRRS